MEYGNRGINNREKDDYLHGYQIKQWKTGAIKNRHAKVEREVTENKNQTWKSQEIVWWVGRYTIIRDIEVHNIMKDKQFW